LILWRCAVSRGGENTLFPPVPSRCSIVPHFWFPFSGELSLLSPGPLHPVLAGTFPRPGCHGHQRITIPSQSQETQARARSRSAPPISPPYNPTVPFVPPLPHLTLCILIYPYQVCLLQGAPRKYVLHGIMTLFDFSPRPPFPLLVEQAVPP
jgi:hypothetical protein